MRKIKQIFSGYTLRYGVGLLYLILSLLIGEFHPFSNFPMYNNFPNWSYVFYLQDENGNLFPSRLLKIDGGQLGHLYASTAQDKNISYGNGMESKQELTLIGNSILTQVFSLHKPPKGVKKISLLRDYYFFQNQTVNKKTTLMYEMVLE